MTPRQRAEQVVEAYTQSVMTPGKQKLDLVKLIADAIGAGIKDHMRELKELKKKRLTNGG